MVESQSPWFETLQIRRSCALRLFTFPYAGGNSYAYRGWQAELPEEIQLCPVQLPGRGRRLRETPYTRMEALISNLGEALGPYCDQPFAFFGHSMGGLIGYELARYLRDRSGCEPLALLISGCTAAHRIHYAQKIYALPDEQLIEELRAFGGSPPEVLENREIMRILLPVFRADLEIIQEYTFLPGSPIGRRVHAFAGCEDSSDTPQNVAPWADLTDGTFELTVVPGGHFFPFTAKREFLRALRISLETCLGEALVRR